ncbi:ribosome silencing factor [Mobiluncus mulieris]|uniref:Ribosomal silencing factor RsfS n=1 Tax=Mobiluncus mulieris TaxID=2052 RepID=A0A7Y0U262_9ACTO|nr:ribosome silencing factor [Mobiluncus mulieris]NMW65586.1 ribosome silencing factor [Mobiluncus mulieris]
MSADSQAIQLAILAGLAAKSKKATEVIALDVSARLALTDIFILASGNNERQVRAIVEAVDETMSRHGVRLARREGFQECRWVLLDYGEIVVHVQHESDRQFYALERLWADAPVVPIPDPDEPATVAPHANSEQAPHESATATATAKITQPISPLDFLANKY